MKHYINSQNGLSLEKNWIFIFPDTTLSISGETSSLVNLGNHIYNTLTKRNPNLDTTNYTDAIENGHIFIAPTGEATTLPGTVTVMRSSQLREGGIADCEAGKIIYESTFKPGESYDRTLGMQFFPSYTSSSGGASINFSSTQTTGN